MRVVVIGAGIAGASSAYQLARRGADVEIVDADLAGAATAAGAGIVSPWTSRAPVTALALAGAAFYPRLVTQLAEDGVPDSSYEVVGGLVVAVEGDVLAGTHQRVTERAAREPIAGAVSRLDPAQARELFPPLAPGLGAVHLSGSARVDGRTLRQALLAGALAHGARQHEGAAALVTRRARVAAVRVAGEEIDADAVVLAAGAWSATLLEPVGIRLDMGPQRGQISHFGLPGVDTSTWPVVLPQSSHYLLAFPGSRVVAGATRETGSGFDHRITASGQQEVLSNALAVAPGLGNATLLETRVGFRPASGDGEPLIGRLDAHPKVVVATGFGPGGLTVGPYAGALVAGLLTGEPEPFDLAPLRPERSGGDELSW